MKNRKYIPKERAKAGELVMCLKCIHQEKCESMAVFTNICDSFKKRAGIRKRRR